MSSRHTMRMGTVIESSLRASPVGRVAIFYHSQREYRNGILETTREVFYTPVDSLRSRTVWQVLVYKIVDEVFQSMLLLRLLEHDLDYTNRSLWFMIRIQIVQKVEEAPFTLFQPIGQQFIGDDLLINSTHKESQQSLDLNSTEN